MAKVNMTMYLGEYASKLLMKAGYTAKLRMYTESRDLSSNSYDMKVLGKVNGYDCDMTIRETIESETYIHFSLVDGTLGTQYVNISDMPSIQINKLTYVTAKDCKPVA